MRAVVLSSLCVLLLALVCERSIWRLLHEQNQCDMTYMYNWPLFIELNVSEQVREKYPAYRLIVYGEARYGYNLTLANRTFSGMPVLFIPGNAGSDRQVRSLGSVSFMKTLMAKTTQLRVLFNYFSVDFDEELSGIDGEALYRQTHYVKHVVKHILSLYTPSTQIVLVGHSMGGLVARGLFLSLGVDPHRVALIITQATPHLQPAISFSWPLVDYVSAVNARWQQLGNRLSHLSLLSVAGGAPDLLVPSHLTRIPQVLQTSGSFSYGWYMNSELRRVWAGADHLCIVWCNQLQRLITRSLFEMTESSTNQIMHARQRRSTLHKHFDGVYDYDMQAMYKHTQTHTITPNYYAPTIRKIVNGTLAMWRVSSLRSPLYLVANEARETLFMFASRSQRHQQLAMPLQPFEMQNGVSSAHLSMHCVSRRHIQHVLRGARYIMAYTQHGLMYHGTCTKVIKQHIPLHTLCDRLTTHTVHITPDERSASTEVRVPLPDVRSVVHAYVLSLKANCSRLPTNRHKPSHDYASVALSFGRQHSYLDIKASFRLIRYPSNDSDCMWVYLNTLPHSAIQRGPVLRLFLHHECDYQLTLTPQPLKAIFLTVQYHLSSLLPLCVAYFVTCLLVACFCKEYANHVAGHIGYVFSVGLQHSVSICMTVALMRSNQCNLFLQMPCPSHTDTIKWLSPMSDVECVLLCTVICLRVLCELVLCLMVTGLSALGQAHARLDGLLSVLCVLVSIVLGASVLFAMPCSVWPCLVLYALRRILRLRAHAQLSSRDALQMNWLCLLVLLIGSTSPTAILYMQQCSLNTLFAWRHVSCNLCGCLVVLGVFCATFTHKHKAMARLLCVVLFVWTVLWACAGNVSLVWTDLSWRMAVVISSTCWLVLPRSNSNTGHSKMCFKFQSTIVETSQHVKTD